MNTAAKDKMRVYETIFSSPGMSEKCKIVLHPSRQTILLLCRLIENGLSSNAEHSDDLIALLPKDVAAEFQAIIDEILQKGGLTDFYTKLKTL